MELSKKEQAVINALYQNKEHAPALDVAEIAAEVDESKATVKGVVGSLTKKGLVESMDVNQSQQVIYITSTGEEHAEEATQHAEYKVFQFVDGELTMEQTLDVNLEEIIDHIQDLHEVELFEKHGSRNDVRTTVELTSKSKPNEQTTCVQVFTSVMDSENGSYKTKVFSYTIVQIK